MVNFAELKKFFIFNLIGSLIISALVAIVTVLIGEFNQLTWKVLFTLFMVVIHSIISLFFIWGGKKEKSELSFFTNVLFVFIVISFVTSLFGVWEVVSAEIIWKLYWTYALLGVTTFHGSLLSKALHKETYLDLIIYANYLFMAVLVFMLLPMIFMRSPLKELSEMFFRILGAVGIVDGTLSILTIIFYKLYMHNHPQI